MYIRVPWVREADCSTKGSSAEKEKAGASRESYSYWALQLTPRCASHSCACRPSILFDPVCSA